ncbi:integrin alpha [Nitrosomonas sp.]|uniref:beta strand repeat-containing protein n=1 Tax=Nitrosomonas sp. TaxID=42353 RepID=UPI00342212ED
MGNFDDFAGYSVSNAGDINGDGFDDVIVGTFGPIDYVVFGKASGFNAKLDLRSLDNNTGFRIIGEGNKSVSNAGDVNGDGIDDFIVGSSVIFGRTSGFGATLDVANLDGNTGFRLNGSNGPISNAGDVNGDGFDDLIAGGNDVKGDGSGSSYVVYGKAFSFSAVLDLSNLDENAGFRLDGVAAGDKSGFAVSNAGDVNGDGFNDLIIGAPEASSNGVTQSGSSYVVFGGDFTNAVTFPGTAEADNLIDGTLEAERFVAGNGHDKMSGGGGADVFHGGEGNDSIEIPDLDFQLADGGAGSDILVLTGSDLNLSLASSRTKISGIERIDLTGSGSNTLTLTVRDLLNLSDTDNALKVEGNSGDTIVGLGLGWIDGGISEGYHTYTQGEAVLQVDTAIGTDFPLSGIIDLSNLNGNNGFRLDGIIAGDYSGYSVSSAGDVNDDGFDDLIVGAPKADSSGSDSGASYVVFGKTSDFSTPLNLSSLDGNNGFRLDGAQAGDQSGFSVDSAGDVNGDGFADLIMGTNGVGASVVFGKAADFDAAMDLSSLDGNNGFRLDGAYGVGGSVSSAGDVNGDGFDDVIIGYRYSYTENAFVVFGKVSGFSANMDLFGLDGNTGFRLYGGGASVGSAGDVNGDGFDDLIIGASRVDPYGSNSGFSYVVFGKASGFDATLDLASLDGSNGFRLDGAFGDYSGRSVSNAGDINRDGFDDLIIGIPGVGQNGASYVVFGKSSGFDAAINLSGLDGSNGFRLDGAIGNELGRLARNAGDINGDGFDDVIVGAPGADPNGSLSGSSYVVFGKASGFDAVIDLSNLDSKSGFRLDGGAAYDISGRSVSGAGDVNGDGFDDLLVGAPYADPNGSLSGSSYVIFGRNSFGGGNVIEGTPGDDTLKGTPAAEIFEAGEGNDRMFGLGGADIFEAGAGNDKITVIDLDFASVDGGAGNDVLHLAGNGLDLNLADSGDHISGIETICLYGKGDNTLTLTAADLLNLSDTTNTLRVNGNTAGHVIVEDGGWVDGGSRGFGYYHAYTHDDAVLLVGHNLTVDFV